MSTSDDLLIPGGQGVDLMARNETVCAVLRTRKARADHSRLISVCSGALIMAAAGVLDGLVSTTHWSRADDIGHYPMVLWDLDRIYTENGRIFTSAGVTSGIDLALAIISKDCGNAAALAVARELVVQLRRTGGQSQYAMHLAGQFTDEDNLTRLIETVLANPQRDWTTETLANEAGVHARTLSRRFKAHLGKTPAQCVECMRVDHARGLLAKRLPLKTVATESGFGDLQRMRRAFQRQLKVDPAAYAQTFGIEGNSLG
jgi:transcriptional regulator GlxA family with amidase domain